MAYVIIDSILAGFVLDEVAPLYSIQTTVLRAVRLFRIARLLRLIKLATGIRKILFSLIISLPSIFNIALLLFLIVFIYAVMGMNLFGNIAYQGIINDVINFQTFPNAVLLMFRLTTAVSWDSVLLSLMVQPPYCDPNYYQMPDGRKIAQSGGSCGDTVLATIFMVTYIALVYLIITNMYVAILLENFAMATEQEEIGVTEDDLEMFYYVWEKYDPHATQFIKYDKLSDFVADLDEPLGIPKPNEIAIVAFNLDVYDGDRLHCLDVLRALVKRVVGKVDDTVQFRELLTKMDQTYVEAFPERLINNIRTTTIHRKKEDVAAKTLQQAWRKHRAERNMKLAVQRAGILRKSRASTNGSVKGTLVGNGTSHNTSNGHAYVNGNLSSLTHDISTASRAQNKKEKSKSNTVVPQLYFTEDDESADYMGPMTNGMGPLQAKFASNNFGIRSNTLLQLHLQKK